jgi:dihydropyrimidine dehydrogenase (NAD+) subunit PreA
MHYGFRIVEHLISGMENWMIEKNFSTLAEFQGLTAPVVGDWADLDLGYKVVAEIDQSKCIHCGLCYIACEDGAHQSIRMTSMSEDEFVSLNGCTAKEIMESGGRRVVSGAGEGHVNIFEIKQDMCVGCNMCSLVCPVTNCINMVERESHIPHITWRQYQDKLAKGEMERIQPPVHV